MKNYKKYLPIIAIVAIVIILCVVIFRPSYSVKSSILSDKTIDGLKITNITLEENNDGTTYQAKVTATEDIEVNYIEIDLTGGTEDVTLIGYIGKSLKKNESSIINASTDAKIIDSTNIEYTIK